MRIRLERVEYMPKVFEPGVLYYADQFGAAAHLCPCGCRHKVHTPIGPSDYSLCIHNRGPTLFPSIGNWQRPCRSHYWIRNGEIVWDNPWSDEEIAAGRAAEALRDRAYFEQLDRARNRPQRRFLRWLRRILHLGE